VNGRGAYEQRQPVQGRRGGGRAQCHTAFGCFGVFGVMALGGWAVGPPRLVPLLSAHLSAQELISDCTANNYLVDFSTTFLLILPHTPPSGHQGRSASADPSILLPRRISISATKPNESHHPTSPTTPFLLLPLDPQNGVSDSQREQLRRVGMLYRVMDNVTDPQSGRPVHGPPFRHCLRFSPPGNITEDSRRGEGA
jgi:hypothetical protein